MSIENMTHARWGLTKSSVIKFDYIFSPSPLFFILLHKKLVYFIFIVIQKSSRSTSFNSNNLWVVKRQTIFRKSNFKLCFYIQWCVNFSREKRKKNCWNCKCFLNFKSVSSVEPVARDRDQTINIGFYGNKQCLRKKWK